MDNTENKTGNPCGPRPGGNNLHSPAKPPSKKLIKALADLSIIIMIMVEENILHIYYHNKPEKTVKGTLKAARLLCNTPNFMKTHKSYIVNLCFGVEFYTVFENYEMKMTNGETSIIGNDYKDEFNEKRQAYSNITRRRRG